MTRERLKFALLWLVVAAAVAAVASGGVDRHRTFQGRSAEAWEAELADPDGFVRLNAVEVVSAFPGHEERATATLAAALAGSDPVLRLAALRMAEKLGRCVQAAQVPVAAAVGDPDPGVREQALGALFALDTDPARLRAAVEGGLRDAVPAVRRVAAGCLLWLQHDPATAALATAALQDTDPRVRHVAAWALVRIGPALALPPLRSALTAADAAGRSAMLGELASTRSEGEALLGALAREGFRPERSADPGR